MGSRFHLMVSHPAQESNRLHALAVVQCLLNSALAGSIALCMHGTLYSALNLNWRFLALSSNCARSYFEGATGKRSGPLWRSKLTPGRAI